MGGVTLFEIARRKGRHSGNVASYAHIHMHKKCQLFELHHKLAWHAVSPEPTVESAFRCGAYCSVASQQT